MRSLEAKALGLLIAGACWGQPTLVSAYFDNVQHSSARIVFTSSTTINAKQLWFAVAPATCTASGGAGCVPVSGAGANVFYQYSDAMALSGLTPPTTYNVYPFTSSNGGSTWSAPVAFTLTTLAAPSPDPALPIAPTPVTSTAYPNTSGYTSQTVASDCHDLQSDLNTAGTNQSSAGQLILIPIGTVCGGAYSLPAATDKKTISSVAVDGTFTSAAHGFTNGTLVRLGGTGCLAGADIYPYGANCLKTGGFQNGYPYYVVNAATNSFQLSLSMAGPVFLPGYVNFTVDTGTSSIAITPPVNSPYGFTWSLNQAMYFTANGGTLPSGLTAGTAYYALSASCAPANAICEFQVSTTPSGSPVSITSAGSGTFTILTLGSGTQYVRADVVTGEIIIRSAAADSALPPAGIRMNGANYSSQTAIFKPATNTATTADISLSAGILTHDVRIGPGIEFAQTDTATAEVMSNNDPTPLYGWVQTQQDSQRIIYDRVYQHALPAPNRVYRPMVNQDGSNIAIINSDFERWNYFHTVYTGLVPTRVSGTQVTFTPGTASMANGARPTVTSQGTINFTGGSASGTCFIYITLSSTFSVLCPTGTSGNVTAPGLGSSFTTSGSPGFPVNGSGQNTAEPIFTITLVSGAVTAISPADGFSSHFDTEGTQGLIAGNGPGPILLYNNFISGTGIPVHFDDSGGAYLARGDYTLQRNTFDTPAYTLFGGPLSDGFRYGNRQPLEWKGGNRIQVNGNIFQNNYAEDNSTSISIASLARGGGYISDMAVTNNTIQNASGGWNGCGAIDAQNGGQPAVSPPCIRQLYQNNLLLNLNGWTQRVAGVGTGFGWMREGSYASADVTQNHNTFYNPLGAQIAAWHMVHAPLQGSVETNSILFIDPNNGYVDENVDGCAGNPNGKALLDCAWTPSYTWGGNVLVPTYTSTGPGAPSGAYDPGTMCTAFGGTWSSPTCSGGLAPLTAIGADVPSRISYVNFTAAFGLNAASPFHNQGLDGTDPGINSTTLQAAQGALTFTSVTPSTTSAVFAYYAWAGTGETCYVQVSANSFATYTTTADNGTGNTRSVTVTGLTASTTYGYRVLCPSATASGTFPTSGGGPTCSPRTGLTPPNVLDIQLQGNMALGVVACTNSLTLTGTCTVVDQQRIVNAALGGACVVGP